MVGPTGRAPAIDLAKWRVWIRSTADLAAGGSTVPGKGDDRGRC